MSLLLVTNMYSTFLSLTASVMTDATYFRICVLPTGISLILFWMLNLPLLFFNFFRILTPWKTGRSRRGGMRLPTGLPGWSF
jgi:hypothetical protein